MGLGAWGVGWRRFKKQNSGARLCRDRSAIAQLDGGRNRSYAVRP
jgi:hypothetical protein